MSDILRALFWVCLVVGAVCAIGYYTYADIWVVPSDDPRLAVSVEPTLRGGDVVLIQRSPSEERGKLFRCADPDEPRRFVVGRLIGPPTTVVTVMDQRFVTPGSRETSDTACGEQRMVNPGSGEEVVLKCQNREFAGLSYQTLVKPTDDPAAPIELHIPGGKGYLFSDNRYLHLDSRDYGLVPSDSCERIFFRLWGATGFTDASRRFSIVW